MKYSNFARQSFLNISPEAKQYLIEWNKATKRWLKNDTTILDEGLPKMFHDHMHTFPAMVNKRFPDEPKFKVPLPPTTEAGEMRVARPQYRLVNKGTLQDAANNTPIRDWNKNSNPIEDIADREIVDKIFEEPLLNEAYGGLLRAGQHSIKRNMSKKGYPSALTERLALEPQHVLDNNFSYMKPLYTFNVL